MSRKDLRRVRCTGCGVQTEQTVYDSVNLGRIPQALDALVDRSFHAVSCPCGATSRIEDPMLWFDLDRGWLLVHLPWSFRTRPAAWEELADRLFQRNLGQGAPGLGRLLGTGVQYRLVFGLEALREKALAWSGGLDDVALEAAKLVLHRDLPGQPLDPDAPLRLEQVHGEGLDLSTPQGLFRMKWSLYEQAQGPRFAEARALLSESPWVDVGCLAG